MRLRRVKSIQFSASASKTAEEYLAIIFVEKRPVDMSIRTYSPSNENSSPCETASVNSAPAFANRS